MELFGSNFGWWYPRNFYNGVNFLLFFGRRSRENWVNVKFARCWISLSVRFCYVKCGDVVGFLLKKIDRFFFRLLLVIFNYIQNGISFSVGNFMNIFKLIIFFHIANLFERSRITILSIKFFIKKFFFDEIIINLHKFFKTLIICVYNNRNSKRWFH